MEASNQEGKIQDCVDVGDVGVVEVEGGGEVEEAEGEEIPLGSFQNYLLGEL